MKNTSPTSKTGNIGEDEACRYLKNKGYRILARNVRYKFGELDIVTKHPDNTLVFVEVKATDRLDPDAIQPEDHMTSDKRRKFERAALAYAGSNPDLIHARKGFRLDVVAVFLIGKNWNKCLIRHYENI